MSLKHGVWSHTTSGGIQFAGKKPADNAEPRHQDICYFVIGNFQTRQDIADKTFNIKSGFDEQTFHMIFEDFAEREGLHVEHKSDDTMILSGSARFGQILESQYGRFFSHSMIDLDAAIQCIEAEEHFEIFGNDEAPLNIQVLGRLDA